MTEPAGFELSDVEVDTLGLVTQGANREEFFMLKSDSATEPTEPSVVTESVWRRISAVIKNAFTMEAAKEESLNVEPATEPIEPVETAKESAEPVEPTESAESTEPAVEKIEPLDVAPSAPVNDPIAQSQIGKEHVRMEDSQVIVAPATETTPTAMDFVSKSEHDEVVRELGVLKAALAKAEEDKERAVYLTKAQSYTALPVSSAELADHMYWLAKTDADRFTWFESIVKAIDSTMHDANLFVEKGTATQIENDAITAALKSADPRAALLAVDKHAASAYLQNLRKAQ